MNIEESSIDILEGDWQYELLKAMYEQVEEQGEGWYPTSQIGTWIRFELKSPARWVGRKLSSLPLFQKRRVTENREWYLSLNIIKEVMERLNYPTPETDVTNDTNDINVTNVTNGIDSDSKPKTDKHTISD